MAINSLCCVLRVNLGNKLISQLVVWRRSGDAWRINEAWISYDPLLRGAVEPQRVYDAKKFLSAFLVIDTIKTHLESQCFGAEHISVVLII